MDDKKNRLWHPLGIEENMHRLEQIEWYRMECFGKRKPSVMSDFNNLNKINYCSRGRSSSSSICTDLELAYNNEDVLYMTRKYDFKNKNVYRKNRLLDSLGGGGCRTHRNTLLT